VHGICNELVSDNGSQFVSEEFKSYLEGLRIKHTRVTPYWARANGLVENFNKSLKNAIRAARAVNKNWHNELYTFLLQYRNTPQLTTGRTPAELLFHRTVMTKVTEMSKFKVPNSLKNRDKEQKQKMKYYADKRMSNDFQKY
jgi:transposase InsO family protein